MTTNNNSQHTTEFQDSTDQFIEVIWGIAGGEDGYKNMATWASYLLLQCLLGATLQVFEEDLNPPIKSKKEKKSKKKN